ncbi:hypothetical protein N657DRAFT_180686 [Parathielavia appendiculata]|uniref:Uncharacterized protein n=1 Tax=Parathielavia appendiculata TaxID=2587402 RepID=A0AAN6U8D0_9PEZI|nr:hypothetical protein N657DRAFT_180686 [Parathielavia appendiculata]
MLAPLFVMSTTRGSAAVVQVAKSDAPRAMLEIGSHTRGDAPDPRHAAVELDPPRIPQAETKGSSQERQGSEGMLRAKSKVTGPSC